MNRIAARRLLAAGVAVGLMGAVTAADPAERSWREKLTGAKPAKPPEPDGTFGTAPPKPTAYAPLEPAVQADAVRAEQDAWQRRMDVCLKLQQVAAGRNDDTLRATADELEKQATALYQARIARLGVKESGVGR